MPKYTTIKELSDAFKSGELDSSYSIIMDKGGNSLRLRQTGPAMPDGPEAEEAESQRYEHCKQLFKWEYGSPLEELFELVGIRAEWC